MKEEKKIATPPQDTEVFVCVGDEMFEGIAKLNGRPNFNDHFPAPAGAIAMVFVCKNRPKGKDEIEDKMEPIIGKLSTMNNISLKIAKANLLNNGFTQVSGEIKDAYLEQYAPSLALAATSVD